MNNKLILVEGLPGTGKTTLSEWLFRLFTDKGVQVELLLERNEKIPSNFYNIAGIPKSDYARFINDVRFTTKTDNYVFVNMRECAENVAVQLQRYDIGNEFNYFISAQVYAHCTLEWWQHWVKSNSAQHTLILDSAFMQCPINEMVFRNATNSEIKTYIQTLAQIVKPLNPVCIYLRRKNADIAIDFAKVVKGEHWAKGIEGLAEFGCPDLFERRFDLENTLLESVPNIVCNIDGFDWSDAELKIQKLFQ
ncbi:MAG: hypothetical protein LBB56_06640 [Chitinispirillales bacterium]|jgi:hypothetical protein|nr:hypothetical protein [Chitinispirillales bacterium]